MDACSDANEGTILIIRIMIDCEARITAANYPDDRAPVASPAAGT